MMTSAWWTSTANNGHVLAVFFDVENVCNTLSYYVLPQTMLKLNLDWICPIYSNKGPLSSVEMGLLEARMKRFLLIEIEFV